MLPNHDEDYHMFDLFDGVSETSSFIEKWGAKVKYDNEKKDVA